MFSHTALVKLVFFNSLVFFVTSRIESSRCFLNQACSLFSNIGVTIFLLYERGPSSSVTLACGLRNFVKYLNFKKILFIRFVNTRSILIRIIQTCILSKTSRIYFLEKIIYNPNARIMYYYNFAIRARSNRHSPERVI